MLDVDWFYEEDDVVILLHMLGILGDLKVVVLWQKYLVSYVFGFVEFLGVGEDEVILVLVLLYYIVGMVVILIVIYGGCWFV